MDVSLATVALPPSLMVFLTNHNKKQNTNDQREINDCVK